jgi:ATP phosphoribosyltransferase regulatory subunit
VLEIYPVENQEPAVTLGRRLRAADVKTELIRKSTRHALTEYLSYADRYRVKKVYYFLTESKVLCCDRIKMTQEEINYSEIREEDF